VNGLEEVRARIAATGRQVKLVAVSKGHGAEAIREAYAAGQRAFGESYAQELDGKARALADIADIEWHFVGHLQTNKAKIVARVAHVVHAVDSAGLVRELGRRATKEGRRIDALVEVNVSGEPQKHGVSIAEILAAIAAEPSLTARGLMTMPPFGDPEAARRVFETLASLRNLHGGPSVLPDLSMGMSDDLEIAIAAGATMVRVGTAIFGPR
jgi:pyridoxal phosphate enzyme (YggS family)